MTSSLSSAFVCTSTNKGKLVRKNEMVVLSGFVTKVLFPKTETGNNDKSRRTSSSRVAPVRSEGSSNYVIAEFKYRLPKNNEKRYSTSDKLETLKRSAKNLCVIKGNLPYKAPYFWFTLKCVRCENAKYGKTTFEVIEIANILRNEDLTYDTFDHIARVENGKTPKDVDNALRALNPHVPNGTLRSNKVSVYRKAIGSDLSCPWIDNSEYFSYERKEYSNKYFPDRTEWLSNNPSEYEKLVDGLKSEDAWMFRFKSHSKTVVHPAFKTKCDVKNKMTLSKEQSSCILCYEGLKKNRKTRGDTFFTEYELPKGSSKPDLDLLLTVKGLFHVDEELLGQPVYSFSSDFKHETRVLDFYVAMDLRRNEGNSTLITKKDYVPDGSLNAQQLEAVNAVERFGVTNVVGYPGCGKTRVICEIYRKYENVAVLTGMASMADELVKKGIDVANHIHMALYHKKTVLKRASFLHPRDYAEREKYVDSEKRKYDEVDVLILDEFEDVSIALASKTFTKLYPNLKRVIQVFDPLQIQSIQPGRPALDTLEYFPPDRTTELTVRYRFLTLTKEKASDDKTTTELDPAPEESCISTNDVALVTGCFQDMVYRTVTLPENYPRVAYCAEMVRNILTSSSSPSSDWIAIEPPCYVRPKDSRIPCGRKDNGKDSMYDVISCASFLSDVMGNDFDEQCLALTNACCDTINGVYEKKNNPSGRLFYSGQKINVRSGNFHDKIIDGEARGGKNPSATLVAQEGEDSFRNGPIYSRGVKNGSSFRIKHMIDYDVREKVWGNPYDGLSPELAKKPNDNVRRCIVTEDDDYVCIERGFVDYEKLKPGWCITVDRSKGREYDNVVFYLAGTKDTAFSKNHVHVAISRARKKMILVGSMDCMIDIGSKVTRKRKTTLGLRLKNHFDSEKKKSMENERSSTKRKRESP